MIINSKRWKIATLLLEEITWKFLEWSGVWPKICVRWPNHTRRFRNVETKEAMAHKDEVVIQVTLIPPTPCPRVKAKEICRNWLHYQSRFIHVNTSTYHYSSFFKIAIQSFMFGWPCLLNIFQTIFVLRVKYIEYVISKNIF